MLDKIQWLGHSSFAILGSPIIYIAPWRVIRSAFHADLILVGHDDYDHCSIADIEKLSGPATQVIGNEQVAQQIADATILRPWQTITIDKVSIKAVPAYSENDPRHPQSDGGLGFVISMNFFDIYYTGDTQYHPQMELLTPDILMLPINGQGCFNITEAVDLVDKLRPRWVIPYNWGELEDASELDAKEFQSLVGEKAQVELLPIHE